MRTYNKKKQYPFRACDAGCADAFREDRRLGLNYGPHRKPEGGLYMNREDWSVATNQCAYCGAESETKFEKHLRLDPHCDCLDCARYFVVGESKAVSMRHE